MDHAPAIAALNGLIDTCKDGEMEFRMSAEHASAAEPKTLLGAMADRCIASAGGLSVLVCQLGGAPDQRGLVAGALQRYRDALGRNLLPDVGTVVDRHYQGVKSNHSRIKALCDSLTSKLGKLSSH